MGFGDASVFRDGSTVYINSSTPGETARRLKHFEALARKDPDHDWSVFLNLPLYDATYQRHGKNKWVLVRKGNGFAS